MKNKFEISFTVTLILLICSLFAVCIPGYAADFVINEETVSVSNVPQNGSLIVAAYGSDNRMLDCKIYNGTGKISGDYAKDMSAALSKAASIKTFLWDMKSIKPFNNDANDVLVIYFSRTGTTETLAKAIHEKTGGDLVEIIPTEPYSEVYNECTARAQREISADARPEIMTRINNIDQYKTIILGYPIWWNTVPPVVRTFLDSYNLSGKTIMPFCTHGGSGISGSMTKLKELCSDSNVTVGLDSSSAASIDKWLDDTGFHKTETPQKALVAYFSATGNTEGIANYIIDITSADKYEIEAAVPYTADDLKYYTGCRADREQNDPSARPAIANKIENIDDYDTIFLGYPIWHGQAPKIIYTFLESYDFGGKTIIPFCTSASSPVGSSATNLHKLAENASWLSGTRFSASASRNSVAAWINGLELDIETNRK